MAALTAARDTISREGSTRSVPVAAATKLFKGGYAVLEGGFAKPGHAAANLIGLGRIRETVDNSTGVNGAVRADIERGVFRFANDAADPIGAADIGQPAYGVDDQTVGKTGGQNKSAVGTVFDVDQDGVWVLF